jgi:hypothetical protein
VKETQAALTTRLDVGSREDLLEVAPSKIQGCPLIVRSVRNTYLRGGRPIWSNAVALQSCGFKAADSGDGLAEISVALALSVGAVVGCRRRGQGWLRRRGTPGVLNARDREVAAPSRRSAHVRRRPAACAPHSRISMLAGANRSRALLTYLFAYCRKKRRRSPASGGPGRTQGKDPTPVAGLSCRSTRV